MEASGGGYHQADKTGNVKRRNIQEHRGGQVWLIDIGNKLAPGWFFDGATTLLRHRHFEWSQFRGEVFPQRIY